MSLAFSVSSNDGSERNKRSPCIFCERKYEDDEKKDSLYLDMLSSCTESSFEDNSTSSMLSFTESSDEESNLSLPIQELGNIRLPKTPYMNLNEEYECSLPEKITVIRESSDITEIIVKLDKSMNFTCMKYHEVRKPNKKSLKPDFKLIRSLTHSCDRSQCQNPNQTSKYQLITRWDDSGCDYNHIMKKYPHFAIPVQLHKLMSYMMGKNLNKNIRSINLERPRCLILSGCKKNICSEGEHAGIVFDTNIIYSRKFDKYDKLSCRDRALRYLDDAFTVAMNHAFYDLEVFCDCVCLLDELYNVQRDKPKQMKQNDIYTPLWNFLSMRGQMVVQGLPLSHSKLGWVAYTKTDDIEKVARIKNILSHPRIEIFIQPPAKAMEKDEWSHINLMPRPSNEKLVLAGPPGLKPEQMVPRIVAHPTKKISPVW